MALESRAEFEPRAPRLPVARFKEPYTYDESILRLCSAGYDRHARPAEFFSRVLARVDGTRPADALAKDMDDCPEWLGLAALWTRRRLVLFEDPLGIYWREDLGRYHHEESEFRAGERHVHDLDAVHPECFIPITDGDQKVTGYYVPVQAMTRVPGLVERLWSKPFRELPAIVRERAVLELPPENHIVPMQFDHPGYTLDEADLTGYAYSICCGVKSGSRGVREVQ
jgi:hypothetical protein